MMTATFSPFSISRTQAALFVFGMSSITAIPAVANSLAGTASFNHGISGGQERDTLQRLAQRYATSFNSELTSAMQLNGNANYNKSWGERAGANESMSPSANLNVQNDIFFATLSGMAISQVPTESPNTDNKAWQASWASAWRKQYWPDLRINYGQNVSTNNAQPRSKDTAQTNMAFNAAMDLLVANISYSYNNNSNRDNINRYETITTNHLAAINTTRTFWDERLAVNFTHRYSETIGELIHDGTGGTVEDANQIAQTTAGVPASVTFGALDPMPALMDNDLQTTGVDIHPDSAMNIGMKFNFNRLVNRIYLYVNPETTINAADVGALRFSLYTSIDGSTFWSQVAANLAPAYDAANHRIILDIPATEENNLKLVTTAWPAITVISLTEVQASYRYDTATAGARRQQKQTNHQSNLNLQALLADNLPFAYNMSLGKNTNGDLKSSTLNQTANLKWNLHRYCRPNFSVSETKSQNTNAPTAMNRSYSINATSALLPSLDIDFGFTQSDSFSGDTPIATNQNYTLSLSAILYPDLNGSFDLNHTQTHDKQRDSLSSTWNASANLTSRLSSKMTTNIRLTHNISSTEAPNTAPSSSSATDAVINLNIRPSDILSLRLYASKVWSDSQTEEAPINHGVDGTLALLSTEKTQLSTGFSYTKADQAPQERVTATWSWTLSRYLSWQTNGSYTISEPKLWNLNSQLATKF
ncbi:MAG: hypothetical protein OEV73_06750 [Desulfobulbaceae bacterium]|nr:hypothetical protein [Desulfobulbaceae bacterium]